MPVLSLACHLPHNTPHIPSRYNNEQTTKQTKAINNSYIYNISCKCDTNRAGHFTLDAYASRPVACLVLYAKCRPSWRLVSVFPFELDWQYIHKEQIFVRILNILQLFTNLHHENRAHCDVLFRASASTKGKPLYSELWEIRQTHTTHRKSYWLGWYTKYNTYALLRDNTAVDWFKARVRRTVWQWKLWQSCRQKRLNTPEARPSI